MLENCFHHLFRHYIGFKHSINIDFTTELALSKFCTHSLLHVMGKQLRVFLSKYVKNEKKEITLTFSCMARDKPHGEVLLGCVKHLLHLEVLQDLPKYTLKRFKTGIQAAEPEVRVSRFRNDLLVYCYLL
jgi:hypothetical protein